MKTTICILFFAFTFKSSTINLETFYSAFAGNSIQAIEKLITELEQQEPTTIINAYKGALMAKKANFENNVAIKIQIFKTGVKLLEGEIEKFPKEIEYRFLRLCVQENCPKILKYNRNIDEDVQIISNNYSKQSKNLKTIIANYAKTSKVLDATLFR